MIAFERVTEQVLREHPSTRLLCRYDRRRWNDRAIDEMRQMHDTELVSPAVYDDNLLRITRNGPSSARLAGEVDRSNRPADPHAAGLDARPDAALALGLRPTSCSTCRRCASSTCAARSALVHAAEEFPSTHRLRLTGVRPRVLRLLERCGGPFAAQLSIESHPEPVS